MVEIKAGTAIHPSEFELAEYLNNSLGKKERELVESHISGCRRCLDMVVSAHGSVKSFKNKRISKKKMGSIMKKINIYLLLAVVTFILSFVAPRYFLQFLVATLLLGIKWVADSKTTKMLVMIHEAWKNEGERGVSRIIKDLDRTKKHPSHDDLG